MNGIFGMSTVGFQKKTDGLSDRDSKHKLVHLLRRNWLFGCLGNVPLPLIACLFAFIALMGAVYLFGGLVFGQTTYNHKLIEWSQFEAVFISDGTQSNPKDSNTSQRSDTPVTDLMKRIDTLFYDSYIFDARFGQLAIVRANDEWILKDDNNVAAEKPNSTPLPKELTETIRSALTQVLDLRTEIVGNFEKHSLRCVAKHAFIKFRRKVHLLSRFLGRSLNSNAMTDASESSAAQSLAGALEATLKQIDSELRSKCNAQLAAMDPANASELRRPFYMVHLSKSAGTTICETSRTVLGLATNRGNCNLPGHGTPKHRKLNLGLAPFPLTKIVSGKKDKNGKGKKEEEEDFGEVNGVRETIPILAATCEEQYASARIPADSSIGGDRVMRDVVGIEEPFSGHVCDGFQYVFPIREALSRVLSHWTMWAQTFVHGYLDHKTGYSEFFIVRGISDGCCPLRHAFGFTLRANAHYSEWYCAVSHPSHFRGLYSALFSASTDAFDKSEELLSGNVQMEWATPRHSDANGVEWQRYFDSYLVAESNSPFLMDSENMHLGLNSKRLTGRNVSVDWLDSDKRFGFVRLPMATTPAHMGLSLWKSYSSNAFTRFLAFQRDEQRNDDNDLYSVFRIGNAELWRNRDFYLRNALENMLSFDFVLPFDRGFGHRMWDELFDEMWRGSHKEKGKKPGSHWTHSRNSASGQWQSWQINEYLSQSDSVALHTMNLLDFVLFQVANNVADSDLLFTNK